MDHMEQLTFLIEKADSPSIKNILANPEVVKLINRSKWIVDTEFSPKALVLKPSSKKATAAQARNLAVRLSKALTGIDLNLKAVDVGVQLRGSVESRVAIAYGYAQLDATIAKIYVNLITKTEVSARRVRV